MKQASEPTGVRQVMSTILLLGVVGTAGAQSMAGSAQIAEGACEQLPVSAPAAGDPPPAQAEARPAPVNSVRRILDSAAPNKTARAKQVLAKQRPVMFTMTRPEAGKLVGDLWVTADSPEAAARQTRCGNTVVLVGYDDARYGGAFEALRDCGATSYGESAFWLRYSDFDTLCQCAVELVDAGAAPQGQAVAPTAPSP